MNKELKDQAKSLTNGICLNLFLPMLLVSVISTVLSSLFIGLLFSFFFTYVNNLFIYKFVNTGKRQFKDLYSDFNDIDNAVALVKANFVMVLYCCVFLILMYVGIACVVINPFLIFLTIFSIIPMIVINYFFFAVPYIVKDSNYKIKAKDAFTLSNKIMKGNKWKLFCLQFSFFFNFLLVGLTFGIYSIWFTPYYETTMSLFYIKVRDEYLNSHNGDLEDLIRPVEEINENKEEDVFKGDFDSPEEVLHKNEDAIFVDLNDDDIIEPEDSIFEEIKEDEEYK